MSDPVNHPQHYTSHPSGIECIEVTRWMNFNCGNVVKYLWRSDLKNELPIEDLEKAAWYLQDEIKRVKASMTQSSLRQPVKQTTGRVLDAPLGA